MNFHKTLRWSFLILNVLATLAYSAEPWTDSSVVDELGGSRNGLNEFVFLQMTPDQLGWMDMNPYALFDLGYIDSIGLNGPKPDLARVYLQLVPLMLSTTGNGPAVRTYFRTREGRAKPLAPQYMKTLHSQELSVTRMLQKGGLPTGAPGGHKDGLLDLPEAYGDMIWGELLHQNGAFSTRGLLAVKQAGVRRNLPTGPGLEAGIMVRFNEFPRLREPHGWHGNYQDQMISFIRYDHPLFGSGIETLDPKQENWLVALHNEALLKDLWILHGSYTFDENRSASLIDFGTTSALYEPNPFATLGYTSYSAEIAESGFNAVERMGNAGRDVPDALRFVKVRGKPLFDQVFLSSYSFLQLRRLGLSDEQILAAFPIEEVPGTRFSLHVASESSQQFARAILEIDKQTLHSLAGFTVDGNDAKSLYTNERVLVNSRKLLREILNSRIFEHGEPGLPELRALIKASFFGTHSASRDPDQIMALLDRDPGKRDYLVAKVREVVSYVRSNFGETIRKDYAVTVRRAKIYPTEQNLPSRREVYDLAWKWANNPGQFGEEFVPFIEARVPKEGPVAAARAHHFKARGEVPRTPPKEEFRKLIHAQSCGRASQAFLR